MKKSILVTGTAGFIGSRVALKFLEEGYYVYGVDNFELHKDENFLIKSSRMLNLLKFPNFFYHKFDLLDREVLSSFFQTTSTQIILHFAAQPGVRQSSNEVDKYVSGNILSFVYLLELISKNKPQLFLFASSSSVYGDETKHSLNETSPTDHPLSIYACTKKTNELFAHYYSNMHDIPTVGLRFFNVYGPSCRPDSALYNFTTSILDGTPIRLFNFGQHLRDFTYIDDVVASVWAIVSRRIDENKNKNLAKYEILNVGSGKNESLISLVNRLETATGKKAKIFLEDRKKEDPTDTLADNHLIKEHYNWSPQIDLSEGIAKFYQWYLER